MLDDIIEAGKRVYRVGQVDKEKARRGFDFLQKNMPLYIGEGWHSAALRSKPNPSLQCQSLGRS
jgi:hypothetical protein